MLRRYGGVWDLPRLVNRTEHPIFPRIMCSPINRATALSLAVGTGKSEAVRFLLEEGADMDLLPFEADGFTPRAQSLVHVAINEGHVDVARLLLQARKLKEVGEQKRWGRRTPLCR